MQIMKLLINVVISRLLLLSEACHNSYTSNFLIYIFCPCDVKDKFL
jgi:hypothetical protein